MSRGRLGEILLAGRERTAVEADIASALAAEVEGAALWLLDRGHLRAAGRSRRRPLVLPDDAEPDAWPDVWRRHDAPAGTERIVGSNGSVGVSLRADGRTVGVLVAPASAARRLASIGSSVAVVLVNLDAMDVALRAAADHELDVRLMDLVSAEPSLGELLTRIEELLGHGVELREDAGPGTRVRVEAGDVAFGWLEADGSLDGYATGRLAQAARAVALHLQRERAVTQARHQLRGEFLDEVIASDGSSVRNILSRAAFLGVDLDRPVAVIFFVGENDVPGEDVRDAIARTVEQLAPRALVAARFGGGVILAAGKEPRSFAQTLAARLAQAVDVPFTIGFAPVPVRIGAVGDAVSEARQAVRGARVTGRAGTVVCRDELGLYGSIVAADEGELVSAARRLLAPLIDYDRPHGTDLIGTLQTYLDQGGNVTEAARRLIIHANSLYYRLGRIRELADYDLDDPNVRFELQLALRVHGTAGGTS